MRMRAIFATDRDADGTRQTERCHMVVCGPKKPNKDVQKCWLKA